MDDGGNVGGIYCSLQHSSEEYITGGGHEVLLDWDGGLENGCPSENVVVMKWSFSWVVMMLLFAIDNY